MKNGAAPFFAPRAPHDLACALVILGAVLLWQRPIRSLLLAGIRWPFTVATRLAATLILLPRTPSLAHENDALKAALARQQVELASAREALRHAQQSGALLQAIAPAQGIIASIIGRSIIPTQQTVLLNRGSRDGLSLSTIVIDATGVIGRLTEVHAGTCLVMLLTDPDSRVAGLVERSREAGLLVGQGTSRCVFTYLDAQADVQAADRILTAGLGGVFPKGLLLGTVETVVRDEQSGTTIANVRPAARLGALEDVVCLTAR